MRIVIDGNGCVLERALVQGSGQALLDQEALAMVKRAEPLPPPPAALPTPLALTLPFRFAIR